MAQESSTTSELTIDVTCTPRNRANLRRLKTSSIQSFQRWEKENELLYAMIEDESAWLSSLFPDAFITPDLFFYALEDGTILCLLANFIQERAENHGTKTGKGVPGKTFTFHKSKKGSRQSKLFHSRENVDKFLTWCRWHGIPEAILFESNDAVLVDECRTGGREIVICLMEIARRSLQYEIEVPQMIKLEREIEEEELSDTRSCAEEQPGLPLETITLNTDTRGDRSPIDSDSGVESVFEEGDPASPRLLEFAADDTKIAQKNKSMNKFEVEKKPQRVVKEEERHSLLESSQPKTELDRKVCKIAQEYNIKIVHRLKEGKYIILGKTMFVRMLNDHLLVRIGGGWDTLDHYVMTHASKSTASGDQTTATPPTSERKSSGVWSKLVDKVKRRESQPSLTESPVVISKRERPDSSPSVYRLRDRVKKKLSVTEKDEKDISDAIRKIESSLTLKASRSSSFTSKTFFQLKNRFDKGRKSSREYLFDNKETKMTDQTVEVITSEQQKETETKEESGTTMLLELETSQEVPEATSTTTETELSANDSSSQKQAEENFPSEDFGLFDQQAQESSGQSFPITDPDDLLQQARESSGQSFPITDPDDLLQQAQESSGQSFPITDPDDLLQQDQESSGQSFPITDPDDLLQQDQESSGQGFPITDPDDLLQQAQESSGQGFPITDPNDLLSNDNPPLFSNEPLQPEQTRYEKQAEIHKDEEEETPVEITSSINEEASKSATDFLEEISQEIESKPNEDSANAKETPPASPAAVPDVNEPRSDIEEKLENVQESSAGEPADLGESDAIIVSLESGEVESAPRENDLLELCQGERQEEVNDHPQENDLLELCQGEVNDHPRENDLLELCQGERQEEVNDHPQVSDEQTEAILDKTEQEDDALPAQLSSHNVTSLEMEVEITTVSGEEGKLEDVDRPTQMTCEDFQFSEMKDMEYVSPDTDKEKDDEAPVSEAAVPDMVEIEKEKEPELSGADVLMPVQLDKDAVSKEREEPEESTNPAQITDEISQVESFEQEKFPGLVCLEESEKAIKEDEQLSKTIDLGEEVPKGESVGSPVEVSEVVPLDEEPKAEEDKKEKEATNVLPKAASAPVNKKTTKKAPGTTKKEHVKAGNSLASKKLSERKKEDQRGEKPKESVTKPSSTRTTKSASTTTAPKAKPVSAANGARSTSATKRPFSAQAKKTGIGASKADATKTTPKTTPKSSESRRPPGTTTTKSTATTDKKPLTTSGNQKSKSVESRPRSAVLMKSSDKKDGKAEAPSRPPSAKMKPFSGTTKTTVKKTTTTTTKTTSGPTPKSEVSKTTITTSEGGKTKTKTTMKKESGGKTKASMAASHQVSSVRNNASEKKSSVREKPGSASAKSKLSSATTTARGKPGNTVAKGKSTSERPKSPTKGTAKKSAPTKDETTVSAPAATNPPAAAEPPAISSIQQEASDLATPSVTADSKENVTSALQDTEAIKDEGETTIVQTKEVTEIVLENGEQQTTIKETVVEESG